MAFSPGQFITAQRLNRLQPKTYWAAASGTVAASQAAVDIPGVTLSITVETNGATAEMLWFAHFYNTGVPAANSNAQAYWDVNAAPVFALGQGLNVNEKLAASQSWVTTIPTAGTYTFKVKATTSTNTTTPVYCTLDVKITEVA